MRLAFCTILLCFCPFFTIETEQFSLNNSSILTSSAIAKRGIYSTLSIFLPCMISLNALTERSVFSATAQCFISFFLMRCFIFLRISLYVIDFSSPLSTILKVVLLKQLLKQPVPHKIRRAVYLPFKFPHNTQPVTFLCVSPILFLQGTPMPEYKERRFLSWKK